jgi:CP family cyanate transporter-like MFS transporter
LGSITSTYFCLNGFLPALLAEHGDGAIVSQALTALNAGQLPASILLVLTADRLQGKRWAYLVLGALTCASVVGITMSAGTWTVIWAAVAGISFGASLPLGLALPPLLCDNPDDVAFTSAAAFAIAYGFAMLMSFLSGAAWDLARDIDAALVVVFFGSLPILFATPRLTAMRSPAAPTPPPSGKA